MSADLSDVNARLAAAFEPIMRDRDGAARQALWLARDGWIIGYTTSRIVGGGPRFDGRFAVLAYKPTGPGARSGKAREHVLAVKAPRATRKAARARAEELYRRHNR